MLWIWIGRQIDAKNRKKKKTNMHFTFFSFFWKEWPPFKKNFLFVFCLKKRKIKLSSANLFSLGIVFCRTFTPLSANKICRVSFHWTNMESQRQKIRYWFKGWNFSRVPSDPILHLELIRLDSERGTRD